MVYSLTNLITIFINNLYVYFDVDIISINKYNIFNDSDLLFRTDMVRFSYFEVMIIFKTYININ